MSLGDRERLRQAATSGSIGLIALFANRIAAAQQAAAAQPDQHTGPDAPRATPWTGPWARTSCYSVHRGSGDGGGGLLVLGLAQGGFGNQHRCNNHDDAGQGWEQERLLDRQRD